MINKFFRTLNVNKAANITTAVAGCAVLAAGCRSPQRQYSPKTFDEPRAPDSRSNPSEMQGKRCQKS